MSVNKSVLLVLMILHTNQQISNNATTDKISGMTFLVSGCQELCKITSGLGQSAAPGFMLCRDRYTDKV
jgi:hypothetical protein